MVPFFVGDWGKAKKKESPTRSVHLATQVLAPFMRLTCNLGQVSYSRLIIPDSSQDQNYLFVGFGRPSNLVEVGSMFDFSDI